MSYPSPISIPKQPKLASWLNRLREEVISSEIKSSPGIKVNRGTQSTTLAIESSIGGSSTPVVTGPFPYDMTLTATTPPDYLLTFYPGKINEYIPSNLLSSFLVSPATTYFVKLACVTDGKQLTSGSIVVDGTPASPLTVDLGAGATAIDITIGVVIDLVAIKIISNGNILATLQQEFLEDKVSPSVGLSPYDRWYIWNVEIV